MTRRDDAGEILEGDGTEDTMLDGNGDNTGMPATGTAAPYDSAPPPRNNPRDNRWTSCSPRKSRTLLTRARIPNGATVTPSAISLS